MDLMNWNGFFSMAGLVAFFGGFLVMLAMPVVIYFFIMSAIANRVNDCPRKEGPRGFPVKLKRR